MCLIGRIEHFLMSETATPNKTNNSTTDEITGNQRTYVTIQDNKHRLKDLRTDSSFKTSRNGDKAASKRSRSKSTFSCKYTCRDREPSRLRCNKIIKMFKKSRSSTKRITHYILYNTPHSSAMKNFLSIDFRIYLATRFCRGRPVGKKSLFS